MKIKDRILLGIVSGLAASMPGRVLNELEFKRGLTDQTYEQAASSIFVKRKQICPCQESTTGQPGWRLQRMLPPRLSATAVIMPS